MLVTWTSSVFRAYPSKWRAIHLEGWQTLQKAPVEVKITALQIINFNLAYNPIESTWGKKKYRPCEIVRSTVIYVWLVEDVLLHLKTPLPLSWTHYSQLKVDVVSSQRENLSALAFNLDRCIAGLH